ncbi:hypothetical protein JL722_3761 [Aureococcus anophagefferens]|nr:hypothetical protein JL722_3761 [Aureococcus anophagefferens]
MLGTASAAKYDKTFEARRPRPTVLGELAEKIDARAQVNIKDTAVSSIEAANLEGEVETQVSDQISAGATYEQNSAKFSPKTLFTRWTANTAKGGDPLEVTATYNVASNTAEVGVESKSGSAFTANFDSARKALITAAEVSRDFSVEGRNLNVAPAYNFVSGVSSVTSNLALSDDTSVELKLDSDDVGNRDALTGTLSIDHNINGKNSIKPTFALNSGSATCSTAPSSTAAELSVNIKEAALLSIDAMNFEGEVETQVSDQIAAGASYDQNSGKFKPKTLFTRWTAKGGDPFKATATYNRQVQLRETLITAADACRDFTVDGRKLKLAPSHDFSGVSSLKSNLALSDDTSVELKLNSDNIGNSDALTGTLSVDHNIDKINAIKHTFALDSGAATHEFRRTLDGDAKLSVAASPGHSRKFAPKTLFTRWTAKGGDPFKVTAIINVAAATAEVGVEYAKFGSKFSANFNSACAQLITTADASRDFTVDGRKLKLAPSHDFASGVSSVTSNLALSPATTVEAKLNSNLGNSDAPTGTLSIDHTIDSIYSIKHSFALDSGSAHKLIVALAMLGTASAGKYDNTWSVDIKDAAVKNIEGVNLEGEVETQANFDTAGDNLLTNVEASRDVTVKGRTVNVAPAYNFVSKVASLTSNLALSADTSVELKLDSTDVSNRDALKGTMSIDHSINANDSIKPTFDLDSGSATYEYTRKLDGDAELTVAANPGKSIEIEWDDAGSKGLWTTNVQMPWGKPVGASVSFKRKFSL